MLFVVGIFVLYDRKMCIDFQHVSNVLREDITTKFVRSVKDIIEYLARVRVGHFFN